jgi:hypothetical protein
LTQPLADRDFATEGVFQVAKGATPSAVVRGAKAENDRLRGQDYDFPRDVRVAQTFFDQILASPKLAKSVRAVRVHIDLDATQGEPSRTLVEGETVTHVHKGDLASDHLPVWTDVVP